MYVCVRMRMFVYCSSNIYIHSILCDICYMLSARFQTLHTVCYIVNILCVENLCVFVPYHRTTTTVYFIYCLLYAICLPTYCVINACRYTFACMHESMSMLSSVGVGVSWMCTMQISTLCKYMYARVYVCMYVC